LRTGWVVEEQKHEEVKAESTQCFFVARGWENMACFEDLVGTPEFKEALQLLLAWGTPFKMVSVHLFY